MRVIAQYWWQDKQKPLSLGEVMSEEFSGSFVKVFVSTTAYLLTAYSPFQATAPFCDAILTGVAAALGTVCAEIAIPAATVFGHCVSDCGRYTATKVKAGAVYIARSLQDLSHQVYTTLQQCQKSSAGYQLVSSV